MGTTGESVENRWASFPRGSWFWPLQVGGWTLYSVLAGFGAILVQNSVSGALVFVAVRTGAGLALTTALRYPFRRMRESSVPLPIRTAAVASLCTFATGIDFFVAETVSGWLPFSINFHHVPAVREASLLPRLAIYICWSALYFAVGYWRKNQEDRERLLRREAETRQAELQLLRAQVNPHFLFNALNSILAEKDHPDNVEAIAQSLADYLRFSLRQNEDLAPLGEELDAIENYLRVEKVRFDDRFEYTITGDSIARAALAPAAVIQPLVENAVKYGTLTSKGPLRILVTAVAEAGSLLVSINNSGSWVEPENEHGTGTGLTNLRRRLDLIYAGRAMLTHEIGEDLVSSRVRVPLQLQSAS